MKKSQIERLERIRQAEMARDFSRQIDPVPPEKYDTLTPDFEYESKNIFSKIGRLIIRGFAYFASSFWNRVVKGMKIRGRENLKGIQNAIVTSNHVNNMDCMMVRQAVFGHRTFITVAEFNNRKGLFGTGLRAGGVLPFSGNPRLMVKLAKLIEKLTKTNNYVLFYPEGSLWRHYEKPRPGLDGAYYFANRYNVPIVPIFITFKKLNKFQKLYRKDKTVVVNILKPIYPDKSEDKQIDIERMKNLDYQQRVECYESFYGKKMEYLPQSDKNQQSIKDEC